jgi:hypothetical protein
MLTDKCGKLLAGSGLKSSSLFNENVHYEKKIHMCSFKSV